MKVLIAILFQEGKIKTDGTEINCVQVGSGNHHVMLLTGVMNECRNQKQKSKSKKKRVS